MSVKRKYNQGSSSEVLLKKPVVCAKIQPQHPLLNHVVLQAVFHYFHVPTLKTCRQVCHQWKVHCTPKLLSKCVISVDTLNLTDLKLLRYWMDSTSLKWFQNFCCDKITHSSYVNTWLFLCGPHIKSFNVSHWWGDMNDLTLADYQDILLDKCPNLDEITIASTANCTDAKNFLLKATQDKIKLKLKSISVVGHTKPDHLFWRLLALCPNLEKLRIDCDVSEEFWNPHGFQGQGPICDFSQIKDLEIRGYANESVSEQSKSYFINQPWTLEKLTMECYSTISDQALNGGLAHISSTLRDLFLILFNRECNQWPMDKEEFTIIPSPIMRNMERLKLEIDDHCTGFLHCQFFVSAIQCPALKSLTLAMYEDGEMNQENWPNGLFFELSNALVATTESNNSFDCNLKCDTLETLTLPPKFQDLSCIVLLRTTFPNLRELTLHKPSSDVVSTLFFCCLNLQRFVLLLSCTQYHVRQTGNLINWNSVLTGIQLPTDESDVKSIGPSIKNFIDLKFLEIVMKDDEPIPLTDLTIYHGLIYLTNIQHLHISGHKFTESALSTLRQRYHPFCRFEI